MAAYNGFKRLSYYLRRMDKEASKELKDILKDTAKEGVKVSKAKAKSLGSTIGKASKSLRASSGGSGSSMYLGGGRYPYALGAELGSKQGYRKKQFEMWKGNPPASPFDGSAGYAVFPALRENQLPIETMWKKSTDKWLEDTWPERI